MHRRAALLGSLVLALLPAPLAAGAQPGRTVRIGWLALEPIPSDLELFRQALSELGYVEGRTLVIEQRYGHRRPEQYAELAAELVRLPVDVIVSTGSSRRRRVTATVPIVFFVSPDPVALGLVASLARPGGNLTGFTASRRTSRRRGSRCSRRPSPVWSTWRS